jgi:hypothetical protein
MGWIVQDLNHGKSKWFFSSPNHPDWLWSLPSILFFPGDKALWHDVDHSPLSSDEVKNDWSFTSTPPICLHGMDEDNCNV